MNRRWFLVLGLFIIGSQLLVHVAFGVLVPSALSVLVPTIVTVLAGVLFVVGGLGAGVRTIEWYQIVGGANILLGGSFCLGILIPVLNSTSAYGNTVQPIMAVAAACGGTSLMFIGLDWIRGGRHLDLSPHIS
jgi:hypothetical protein